MIDRGGGSIINVASMLGHVDNTGQAGELLRLEGAVVNMTRELALQWARKASELTLCPAGSLRR